MATPRKKPEDKLKVGRHSGYKAEFCEMLLDHLSKGYSFTAFGAVAKCCKETLYTWTEEHPEFLDAKKKGETLQHLWWENFGRQMASGQIRRLVSEKAAFDKNGEVIRDAEGNVVMDREYDYSQGAQTIYIWMTKNILKWRDESKIVHEGGNKPIQISPLADIPENQLNERIRFLNTILIEHSANKSKPN